MFGLNQCNLHSSLKVRHPTIDKLQEDDGGHGNGAADEPTTEKAVPVQPIFTGALLDNPDPGVSCKSRSAT